MTNRFIDALYSHNRMTQDNFYPAPANQAAFDAIERWPNWPAPSLAIFGEPACGKTHLGAIWMDKLNAANQPVKRIHGSELNGEDNLQSLRQTPYIIIDEAEHSPPFHLMQLYNLIREAEGNLLLLSRQPPAIWASNVPELSTRLISGTIIEITQPDDALLIAIIDKLFCDRQIKLPPTVIKRFVRNLERSYQKCREIAFEFDVYLWRHQSKRKKASILANNFIKEQTQQ